MLYETAWFDKNDFKYYERIFDPKEKKSFCRKINNEYEYFTPDNKGDFSTLVDDIKVRRCLGKAKDTSDQYGVTNPIYLNIREKYWNKHLYNLKPRTWYLDIETRALGSPDPDNAPYSITLIQIFDSYLNKMIVLGLRAWKEEEDYKLEYPVKYVKFDSEKDMLQGYLKIFKALNPLIIYAWNGLGFDFPYIYHRLKHLSIEPQLLSNYNGVEVTKKKFYDFKVNGHYYLDLMDVYKKFVSAPRSSYSLDSISSIELNANKVDHTEFGDFDSFYTGAKYTISETPYKERVREEIRQCMIVRKRLPKDSEEYKENERILLDKINFQFVYYGITDVILLKKLDDKLKFTDIIMYLSDLMGVSIKDTLGTVRPWSQYISNVAYQNKQVMPKHTEKSDLIDINFLSFETQEKVRQYLNNYQLDNNQIYPSLFDSDKALKEQVQSEIGLVGAFVKNPVVGKHHWVVNADVNSMYPMLSMATFNMSPETYVSQEKLPQDLRVLVNKYFSGQKEGERLNLDRSIWNEVTRLLKKYNLAMAVNGACFKRDFEGIIPRLVKDIYSSRKKDKKTMQKYENQKVLISKILNKRGIITGE